MANELRVKTCTGCLASKPLDAFCKNASSKDGLNHRCRTCWNAAKKISYQQRKEQHAAKGKAYYEANRERALERQRLRSVEKREEIAAYHREYRLRAYGLSLADYKAMEAAQSGLCFICGGSEAIQARLVVDHDHATGKVRKLLCTPCNTTLGLMAENVVRLRAMADYIEAHLAE